MQVTWKTLCKISILKLQWSPASNSIPINGIKLKSITLPDRHDSFPLFGESVLSTDYKAFSIRHQKANRSHSIDSWEKLCTLSLPCLPANNTNLSEQMKVNFETSKTFQAPCHRYPPSNCRPSATLYSLKFLATYWICG